VSEVFEVEPKIVTGSSQVSIRVGNGTLDYENPNQRKFIVLVEARELLTTPKLSSTATLTISVTDANDNRPVFEQESYSTTVSETAHPGQLITTITAKDMDSGLFGDQGIRYSLSGTGSELFDVDSTTGAITVAKCDAAGRGKRQVLTYDDLKLDGETPKQVNITYVGQTGVVDLNTHLENGDQYNTYQLDHQHPGFEHNDFSYNREFYETTPTEPPLVASTRSTGFEHLGKSPCLDYETQSVYFLSYKATDDEGRGQTTVVSLRISLTDANDSPPVCESPLYRASLDEGAQLFDPPLFIKARDPDVLSEIVYR
jgi:Cadherin domain